MRIGVDLFFVIFGWFFGVEFVYLFEIIYYFRERNFYFVGSIVFLGVLVIVV